MIETTGLYRAVRIGSSEQKKHEQPVREQQGENGKDY